MDWSVIAHLPPGVQSRTRLATRLGEARLVVLRQLSPEAQPFAVGAVPAGVLPLLDVTEDSAVYPFVASVTLREVVDALREAGERVPLGLVARALVDAGRALGPVGATRVHGAVSDTSLLVGFDGVTRVMDYGAPRPSRFSPPGLGAPTADVFSLGAVLHSSLTGFPGTYADAVSEALPLPAPTTVHPEASLTVDDVVTRALSRNAAQRQADAGQLADELETVLADELFGSLEVAALVESMFHDRHALLLSVQQEAPQALLDGAAPADVASAKRGRLGYPPRTSEQAWPNMPLALAPPGPTGPPAPPPFEDTEPQAHPPGLRRKQSGMTAAMATLDTSSSTTAETKEASTSLDETRETHFGAALTRETAMASVAAAAQVPTGPTNTNTAPSVVTDLQPLGPMARDSEVSVTPVDAAPAPRRPPPPRLIASEPDWPEPRPASRIPFVIATVLALALLAGGTTLLVAPEKVTALRARLRGQAPAPVLTVLDSGAAEALDAAVDLEPPDAAAVVAPDAPDAAVEPTPDAGAPPALDAGPVSAPEVRDAGQPKTKRPTKTPPKKKPPKKKRPR